LAGVLAARLRGCVDEALPPAYASTEDDGASHRVAGAEGSGAAIVAGVAVGTADGAALASWRLSSGRLQKLVVVQRELFRVYLLHGIL
jgi:hypothetical protein